MPSDAVRLVSRTSGWVPAVVLAALGGALLLQRRSLWYDELFTAQVGTSGPVALVRAVLTGEGTASYLREVPPSYNAPYYVVVQAWLGVTRLPADEVGLRLLSLCAAVAGVAVLTAAVTRLAGRTAGRVAGLLAATSPMVVEYAAEGRMYGLALLATATAVLGLARWLEDGRLGLWAVGATAAGLAHWFAVPVVAGLVLAALVLRRRRALPLLAVATAAVLPTLGLAALVRVNGEGSGFGWIRASGGELPLLAVQAWTGGGGVLLLALLAAVAVGVLRGQRTAAVVAGCWVGLPLAALTAVELLRPVFVPRYLLPTLLGLAVLAAVGLARLPRWALVGGTGLLVALQLVAVGDVLDRGPREDARGAVAGLRALQRPGEVVVAVDPRAALALEQYGGRLQPDVVVPPADPPAGQDVVWLLRQAWGERLRPSDDDAVLRGQWMQVAASWTYTGTSGELVVQRWSR